MDAYEVEFAFSFSNLTCFGEELREMLRYTLFVNDRYIVTLQIVVIYMSHGAIPLAFKYELISWTVTSNSVLAFKIRVNVQNRNTE